MPSLEHLVKRWLVGALLALGVVLLTALVAGMLLPERHEISRTLSLSRTPEAAWRAITDSVIIRSWRTDLASLENLPDTAGMRRWREVGRDGARTEVRVVLEQPPVHRRTLRRSEGPQGKQLEWDYVIEREPSGIAVRVLQRGRIPGRVQRFTSQFSSGHAADLEAYLTLLAAYFDEPARIR